MTNGIFSEILTSLRQNKLRTFLTGFSVAWGIFMLIILLSAGNGLKNGVMSNMAGEAVNTVELYSGTTTLPFHGYKTNRFIRMDERDVFILQNQMPEVGRVFPKYSLSEQTISYGKKHLNTSLTAVSEGIESLDGVEVANGRFVNYADEKQLRKSIVLVDRDAVALFGTANPVGKIVVVGSLPFQVVGVYKTSRNWQSTNYIPYSTAEKIYNGSGYIDQILFTINGLTDKSANQMFNQRLKARLARLHDFDPHDEGGIYVWNQLQSYLDFIQIFSLLNAFIWIIGIGTLIAGIVGVSNIMLITVRERTKEFGIRKALGAPPRSILSMVVWESLIITSFFGYIGMLFGIIVTEIINFFMVKNGLDTSSDTMSPTVFKNPTVDLHIVFAALAVLIIAGVLAGFFPAKKAVKIKPIEALRYE